jgi:hypothetical protein
MSIQQQSPPALTGAASALREMRARVTALSETLWAARPGDELLDATVELESLKSQLDALQLDLARELEARREPQRLGWASTQDFLTAVAGGHKGHGPAMVRLAAWTADPAMVPIAEAMADGWLSTIKAQVIARAVDELPHEPALRERGVQALLAEAKRLDATDLRKAARHLFEVVDPDGAERKAEKDLAREERAAHDDRFLSVTDDLAGGARIKGRCSAEDAALIRATLLPLSKPRPRSRPDCDPASCTEPGCSHDGRDPRDHGARFLDALVDACRRLQTAGVLPESHGASPRMNLVMGLDDLRHATGFATTDTGEDLSCETARRLACDAEVLPVVLGKDSAVLDVGRMTRLVTAAIWYALVVRDRHCRFPGCTRPPVMCHAHHLIHWIDGGATSLDNLVLLCGHHHRLVHNGPWVIRRTGPVSFAFDPPPGTRRSSPTPRPPPTVPDG